MAQPRGDLDLAQEAIAADGVGELRLEQLQRDLAAVAEIVGEGDGGHPAAPDHALDAVAAGERRTEACGVRHWATSIPEPRGEARIWRSRDSLASVVRIARGAMD